MAKKPTETQFMVLRQMALFELPLVRRSGGFWCLADDANDTGLRPHREGEWSVTNGTQVVRALERAGWIQRSHRDERAWCDPRELTAAGRAVWPGSYQGRPTP